MRRKLSSEELEILGKLMEEPFQGRDAVVAQIKKAVVTEVLSDGVDVGIRLDTTEKARAKADRRVPVIGVTKDAAGGHVSINLHVVDGQILELQIVRSDGNKLEQPIDVEGITIFRDYPPMPERPQ